MLNESLSVKENAKKVTSSIDSQIANLTDGLEWWGYWILARRTGGIMRLVFAKDQEKYRSDLFMILRIIFITIRPKR